MILPYPFPIFRHDTEQLAQDMLYRHMPVFATGHGCAADWEAVGDNQRAISVSAECLPRVELPTVTPDIRQGNGKPLTIGMKALSMLEVGSQAWGDLEQLVTLYETWIENKLQYRVGSDFPQLYAEAVSYTHLRAHETDSYLVCRLLLEK